MKRLKPNQIKALKYLIKKYDLSLFTKQIMFTLIDASKSFTRPVVITLLANKDDEKRQKEVLKIANEFHDMCSVNCGRYMDEVLELTGSKLKFEFFPTPDEEDRGFQFCLIDYDVKKNHHLKTSERVIRKKKIISKLYKDSE